MLIAIDSYEKLQQSAKESERALLLSRSSMLYSSTSAPVRAYCAKLNGTVSWRWWKTVL